MRPSRKKRAFFALFCKQCFDEQSKRHENYKIMLNPQNRNPKEIEKQKFCPHCRSHQPHRTKQISRSQNK